MRAMYILQTQQLHLQNKIVVICFVSKILLKYLHTTSGEVENSFSNQYSNISNMFVSFYHINQINYTYDISYMNFSNETIFLIY